MRDKPWYKSLTVRGVLTGVIGFAAHPAVFGILPPKVAAAVGVAGAALATLGLRRAIASAPGDVSGDGRSSIAGGEWENTFNAAGFNPYGETREEVTRRREAMDRVADDNRAFLMGKNYVPKPGE